MQWTSSDRNLPFDCFLGFAGTRQSCHLIPVNSIALRLERLQGFGGASAGLPPGLLKYLKKSESGFSR
jgi:hypothetical protein